MTRLEIIHLRSSGKPIESLAEKIRESIDTGGHRADAVTLYRRSGLDTDVAVHIRYAEPRVGNGPSDLALHLASALRVFGIVEHTLWNEVERVPGETF